MARDREPTTAAPESVISIIAPGMKIIGRCETDGTVRVEGTVEGGIAAGKAVVVGKQGCVIGDITTQDAVISGRVEGRLEAASRLELQATSHIEGEVFTRRMQLEEGAVLNANVHMGSEAPKVVKSGGDATAAATPAANGTPSDTAISAHP